MLFPGHEYAVACLKFAAYLLPTNTQLREKLAWCRAQRERGITTLPTRLGEERAYNPYLRLNDPLLRATLLTLSPAVCELPASVVSLSEAKSDEDKRRSAVAVLGEIARLERLNPHLAPGEAEDD
jgi:hypothetical protein